MAKIELPETTDAVLSKYLNPGMLEAYENKGAYQLIIEPTYACYGSCIYCYASATPESAIYLKTARVLELIDQASDIGIRMITWCGGDPQLHPDIFKFMRYCLEKGMDQYFVTSGMITREDAKELVKLSKGPGDLAIGIHIDSLKPEIYNQIHTDPSSLAKKVAGYHYLLRVGFPADHVAGCLCLTKPAMETFEESVDWYLDEMGAVTVVLMPYRDYGFGKGMRERLEPSIQDQKRAIEYRAKKCGSHWLKMGSTENTCQFCNTLICIHPDGRVTPCVNLHEEVFTAGNIYEESLVDIYKKHRAMLVYDFEVTGFCKSCEYSTFCRGCRARTYHETGDITASDPHCFRNPANWPTQ